MRVFKLFFKVHCIVIIHERKWADGRVGWMVCLTLAIQSHIYCTIIHRCFCKESLVNVNGMYYWLFIETACQPTLTHARHPARIYVQFLGEMALRRHYAHYTYMSTVCRGSVLLGSIWIAEQLSLSTQINYLSQFCNILVSYFSLVCSLFL